MCATVDHAVHEAVKKRRVGIALLLVRASSAARDGVSVTALNTDRTTAHAMVKANCWYICPVVPGKNATGTNTDDQHDTDHDHGAEDFTHGVH